MRKKSDIIKLRNIMGNRERADNFISKRRRKQERKTGFYYSFLTIILIFCLIQIGYGAILNISKIISYKAKAITLENLLKEATQQNEDLKTERKMITSDNSLEGIARNNLKMAGQDEVLVIINKKVETPKKKKSIFKKLHNFSFKKLKKEDNHPEMQYIPEEMSEE